jgi:hypothetical protein
LSFCDLRFGYSAVIFCSPTVRTQDVDRELFIVLVLVGLTISVPIVNYFRVFIVNSKLLIDTSCFTVYHICRYIVTPGFRGPKLGREINTGCVGTKSHTYDESWYRKQMSHLYYIIGVLYKIKNNNNYIIRRQRSSNPKLTRRHHLDQVVSFSVRRLIFDHLFFSCWGVR